MNPAKWIDPHPLKEAALHVGVANLFEFYPFDNDERSVNTQHELTTMELMWAPRKNLCDLAHGKRLRASQRGTTPGLETLGFRKPVVFICRKIFVRLGVAKRN